MTELDDAALGHLALEHVTDALLVTDEHERTVWVNPAFERMTGFTREDIIGKRPGDLLQGPETSTHARALIRRAIDGRYELRTDIVNYTKSGNRYISDLTIKPVRTKTNNSLFFIAIQRNVTTQRGLSDESIDLKAYRTALDQMAIISVTDPQGRITFVNSNFTRISEFSEQELIGSTHQKIRSGKHARDFFQGMWETLQEGRVWTGEICNRKRSGDLFWVDTTIVPVRGEGGKIVRYVSTHYDITARKTAEIKLRRIAETDMLTGLPNRQHFMTELTNLVGSSFASQADDQGADALVAMIDLDHFKDVNDALGHHYGDQLLREFGQRLQKWATPAVSLARIGGDEFAVIINYKANDCITEDALSEMQRLLSMPVVLDGLNYWPSFSIGLTRFPEHAATAEDLLINADVALYEAKRNGRNRACIFSPSVKSRTDYRNQLRYILHEAIENDSFSIALQPIVSLKNMEHMGFEVLARLEHRGKQIPAGHFIPLAEDVGLIGAIGRQIIKNSFAALNHLKALGCSPGFLSINVAGLQLREQGFVTSFEALLINNSISPKEICIELTETAFLGRSTEVIAESIRNFRNLGVSVALDDFGAGFSSLTHLKDFGVDKVKLDISFVRGIHDSPRDRRLTESLIHLSKNLGLTVIAEGVEQSDQLQILKSIGCCAAQGYLIARPLSIDGAAAWLEKTSPEVCCVD